MDPKTGKEVVHLIRESRTAALGTVIDGHPLVTFVLYNPKPDLSTPSNPDMLVGAASSDKSPVAFENEVCGAAAYPPKRLSKAEGWAAVRSSGA